MLVLASVALLWAFMISVFAIPSIIKIAKEKKLFDEPNARTVHNRPIPRLGGMAIFAGFLSAFTVFGKINVQDRLIQEIIAALIVLFFIGLKDDLIGISVFKKFFVQVFATGIVVFFGEIRISSFYGLFGIYELADGVSYLFTCMVILGITNAMNLIDGLDGLAGSVTCMIALAFGYYFYICHNFEFFIMAACLLGSVAGFLRYNFKKAQIFMGDTGSLLCGFLISVFAIEFIEISQITNAHNISLAIIFIPIFDMIRVVVIRILSGKSPFTPDKNHIHHVLLSTGLSQHYTVVILLLINGSIIFAVSYFSYINPTTLFLLILSYGLVISLVLELIKRKQLS